MILFYTGSEHQFHRNKQTQKGTDNNVVLSQHNISSQTFRSALQALACSKPTAPFCFFQICIYDSWKAEKNTMEGLVSVKKGFNFISCIYFLFFLLVIFYLL